MPAIAQRPSLVALALLCILGSAAAVTPPPPRVPIEHFASDDRYRNPVLSPDGTHIAVHTRVKDNWWGMADVMAIIRLRDMQTISAIKMERFEVPVRHWWVSNTRLLTTKARDIGEAQPVNTGEILATDMDGKNQAYLYGYRQRGDDYGSVAGFPAKLNGNFYLGETNARLSKSALYQVDSMTGKRSSLLELDLPHLSILLDHQNRPRFASATRNDGFIVFLQYDLESKEWAPDKRNTKESYIEPVAFSDDDSALYALASGKDGPESLIREDLASGARTVVGKDPNGDVDLVFAGSNGNAPFAWKTSSGKPVLHYLQASSPLAQLHKKLSAQFPDDVVTLLNASENGGKVLFRVSSDRDPGMYYLFDAATQNAELLFTALEQIDPAQMGERRPVSYKARDGMELHGFLTLPPGLPERALPLVLLPHGGPIGIADTWFFDPDAQFLATRGYAVLQVNFRGSGGRGQDFSKAGYRQWGGRIIDDLVDGVQWAIASGIVDKQRICSFGISFGAYASMMLAAREPGLFKCAIGYAGVYDLTMSAKQINDEKIQVRKNTFERFLGNDPAEWRRNSPTELAAQIKQPVLLIHGGADDITPVAQGQAMRDALKAAGNPPAYLQVRSEGHGFYLKENKLKVYRLLEEFLAKHIGQQ